MILWVFFIFFSVVGTIFLRWLFSPYFVWKKNKKISAEENIFILTGEKKLSYAEYIKIDKKIDLSIVVPAYNEEQRLPIMLDETSNFLNKQPLTYEILVINDGSKDKTTQVALEYASNHPKVDLKVVEFGCNKGKGGAIRIGMLSAKGKYMLMADADAATDINDFTKVFEQLKKIAKNDVAIVAGSRNHLVKDVVTKRKFYRNILMYCFNFVVKTICGVKLRDTQCGFKLFTHQTAKLIFNALHLERWAFDVEVFILANYHKIPVAEVPVNWHDVDGSKLNVVSASLTMARDFLLVRVLYVLGIWKTDDVYLMPSK